MSIPKFREWLDSLPEERKEEMARAKQREYDRQYSASRRVRSWTKVDAEAYREYMRLYQREYHRKYRELCRQRKDVEGVEKTKRIRKAIRLDEIPKAPRYNLIIEQGSRLIANFELKTRERVRSKALQYDTAIYLVRIIPIEDEHTDNNW